MAGKKKAPAKTAAQKADEARANPDASADEKKAATQEQFDEADAKGEPDEAAAAEASIARNQVTGF